jgi:hypothetical protein
VKAEAPTLQFIVMLDPPAPRQQISAVLLSAFPGAVVRPDKSMDIRNNWVEIRTNEFADAASAADPDEGYLYYGMEIRVTPLDRLLTEDHQVKLATEMRHAFHAKGFRAVVGANFEDKIDITM